MALRHLVLDSSAFISNAQMFAASTGDGSPFFGVVDGSSVAFSVPEITSEVRDAGSRDRLQSVLDFIKFRDPMSSSLAAVRSFARKTGDLRSLSAVDVKILALTYELEVEQNGQKNIKPEPKEMEFTLPRKVLKPLNELPPDRNEVKEDEDGDEGWTTVTKKKSGRAAEHSRDKSVPAVGKNENIQASLGSTAEERTEAEKQREEDDVQRRTVAHGQLGGEEGPVAKDDSHSQVVQREEEEPTEDVAKYAVDISDENSDEERAPSLSEEAQEEEDDDDKDDDNDDIEDVPLEEDGPTLEQVDRLLRRAVVEEEIANGPEEDQEEELVESDDGKGWIHPDNLQSHLQRQKGMAKASEQEEGALVVGCVTTDYAMQNVLLQMGLKLLSVDGSKVIKRVKRFILRCSACTELTRELERLFCPKCGNNTLVKLPFSVDKKGVARVYYDPRRNPSLRGTKYSIPKPKGGRHCKDLILTEDQIAQRKRQLPRRSRKSKMDPFDPNTKYNAGAHHVADARIVVGYGRKNPNVAKKSGK